MPNDMQKGFGDKVMMRPCKHCLNNKWTFETLDNGYIRATCQSCSKTVEWTNKKLQHRKNKVHAPFKPYFSDEEISNQPGPPPWDPPWVKR